jgi:hypothetical protein
MPQIQGVEGEAVVIYRELSTTQEMRYHRLSSRVNNMAVFPSFLDISRSELENIAQKDCKDGLLLLRTFGHVVYATLGSMPDLPGLGECLLPCLGSQWLLDGPG